MKPDSSICPQCGTAVPEELFDKRKVTEELQTAAAGEHLLQDHAAGAAYVMKRRISIVVVSAVLLFPILIFGMTDLLLAERHFWLQIAELSLGSLWMLVMVLVFSRLSAVQRTVGAWGILFLYLLLMERILPSDGWFGRLAMPLITLCALGVLCCLPIIRRFSSAESSLRMQAVLLSLELAVFCLLLDGIINRYRQAEYLLSWSITVLLVVIPAAGLFVLCASIPRIRNRILRLLHI